MSPPNVQISYPVSTDSIVLSGNMPQSTSNTSTRTPKPPVMPAPRPSCPRERERPQLKSSSGSAFTPSSPSILSFTWSSAFWLRLPFFGAGVASSSSPPVPSAAALRFLPPFADLGVPAPSPAGEAATTHNQLASNQMGRGRMHSRPAPSAYLIASSFFLRPLHITEAVRLFLKPAFWAKSS